MKFHVLKRCFNVAINVKLLSWLFKVKTTLIIIWFRFQRWKPCWITIDDSCNLNLTIPQRWNTMHLYWLTCFTANFDTVYSRLALCQNLFKCTVIFFLSPSLFFLMFCFRELLTHSNYSFTHLFFFFFLIP